MPSLPASPAKPGRAVIHNGVAEAAEVALTPTSTTDIDIGPPYTPRPRPQQQWVHSCCTIKKLERALANPNVSAIEADIMMGHKSTDGASSAVNRAGGGGAASQRAAPIPIMAHPTWRKGVPSLVDMSFADFLERCLADGTRHLKLDFKDLRAVEPCLELLAQQWPQLHANGQAIWLNADVLPGPNARGSKAVRVPAREFVPLCRRLCPHAVLSLGWCVGPLGAEEKYTEHDIEEMKRICVEYNLPGAAVVFAASLRLSERAVPLLGSLLGAVVDAQILFWTGTGEPPVYPTTYEGVYMAVARMGYTERVGYDIQVARSCCSITSARAIDCTFFWSRWSRWLCCPYTLTGPAAGAGVGERQPLVIERANGTLTPNVTSTPSSCSHSTVEMPSAPRMPSLDSV